MGGFISSLFGWSSKPVRVLMVGLDAAGKTTILYKLKLNETVSSIPTIGFNVEEVAFKNVNFTVWDIGGQDRIRKLWRHYYPATDAVIYVVDSNDAERLEESRMELESMLRDEALDRAILLVYANKQDLPNARSISEVANALQLPKMSRRKWHLQGTSALNGSGLYEGLEWLNTEMKNRRSEQ
jgi:small GTP-binding protein